MAYPRGRFSFLVGRGQWRQGRAGRSKYMRALQRPVLLLVLSGAIVLGCREDEIVRPRLSVATSGPQSVASVTVSPASATVEVGQTVQLTATLSDANGKTLTGRTVSWSSNNSAVATV